MLDKVIAAIVAKSNAAQSGSSQPAKELSAVSADAPVVHSPAINATHGIVEAEIGSGDLKPARFAKLLVIPADKAGPVVDGINQVGAAADTGRRKADNDPERSMVEIECLKALVQLKVALVTAGINASSNPSQGILAVDADESGQFSFTETKPEPFVIIAIGKAGMNAGDVGFRANHF